MRRTSYNSTITPLNLGLAFERLKPGDVIAIFTETVYGLSAEFAIKRIFTQKKCPITHPLILHVAHNCNLSQWAKNLPTYESALIVKILA